MAKWKAIIKDIEGEVWHTTVNAKDEIQATRKALDVFLNTEDEQRIEFGYTTLAIIDGLSPVRSTVSGNQRENVGIAKDI